MRKRPSSPSARFAGSSAAPIVALEKRIAFDGAAAATAAKAVRTATVADLAHHSLTDASRDTAAAHRDSQTEHGLARTDAAGAARALRGLDAAASDLRAPARSTTSKSVVFIESDVPDVATLIKDVDHSAQIVLLDPKVDGVDAIASYLAVHKGVQDVYIFSHGSQGQLDLGTATLDSASMQGRYASDMATIKGALAPGANILVYGCDFAEGVAGDAAAHLLSQLTGAAIAASTNLTGGAAEGGDFVLEDHVGTIDAPGVLSSRIALDYHGLLAAQSSGAFTTTSGAASGTATSAATVATATTADGAVKIVVTVTPNGSNTANSITTTTTNAAFDKTAPAASFPTGESGAAALEETLQFGGSTANGATDGTNSATISIAYYDAKTGAAIMVANPIIYIDRLGGTGKSSSGSLVTNSSDLTILNSGATLTQLGASSSAFNVTSTDVYETVNTGSLANPYSSDANSDATKGTAAGAIQVKGSYSTLSFNWAKASGSTNGGDRIDLIFSADTAMAQNGSLPPETYTDGQSGISIATSQAFSNPSGLSTTYTTSGLPAGLSIDASTGVISGTIDHDASKNGPVNSGSGATLDGTYSVTVTATNSANNAATQTFTIDSKNNAPVIGTVTTNQTNNDGDTINAVDASKAFSDPNGDPLTYTATGLPAGLTISSAGVISGMVAKNAQPGNDTVTVTGTDDKGASIQETFTWTVKDVPPTQSGTLPNQVYNDGQSGISIATSQGFSDSVGNSLTYSASGLPTGLSIDATTGKITGTIDHDASTNAPSKTGSGATLDGKYSVVVTASDGLGGTATQSFTVDSKNQAPIVGTKTANQANNDGDAITAVNAAAAFSDGNGDPLTYTATGLPPGLTISSAGMITGTVAKNAQPGSYSVTVTATDDKGAATPETFTWTISDVPPAKTGALANQTYNDGQGGIAIATAQGFTDANGNALTYSATGLPKGLSIDPTSGKITGTIDHDASTNAPTKSGSGATLDGTYAVVVTASDGLGGTATQSFTVDSKNQAPTLGTATANQSNSDGDTITAVDASKAFSDSNSDPLTYTATGLPPGLTISSAGMITGTVAKNGQPGSYSVTVTATDDKGAATPETFTWTISDVPPAKNGTLANQTYNDGQGGIAIATAQGFTDANGNALTYSATGLPKGLSIDPTSGKITGTIDHDASTNAPTKSGSGATLDGTYTVVVTASDGLGGTATQSFTVDSKNQAPTLGTATANQSNSDGDTIAPVNAAAAYSDTNGDSLTYTATGLPAGLAISATGSITGTVSKAAQPGNYSVVVTATDDKGAATSETFTWTVNDVPPTAGADTFSTLHNTPVAINVLGNDSDALGRQLTITQVNGTAITAGGSAVAVASGSVKLNADSTLTFTPNTGYAGTPSFTYTLADPVGGTTTGTVTGVVSDARPIVDLNGPQALANTIVNGTSLGSSGWSASGGGQSKGGYYFNADYGTGSLSQANVPGLNLGAGAYGASQLSFGFGWNNGSPDVKGATVNVTVGGVVYAQIVTGTPGADPNIATITYLNGASGNLSSVTATAYMNWTPSQVTIDLPANVAAKGTVAFNVDSSSSTDDVFFNNVSTTTLPATSYGYATSFTEKGPPVAIAATNASVFDGDDANATSASVVLTNKLAGDQLSVGGNAVTSGSSGTINGLSYTVSDAGGAETIVLSGSATKAVYAQTIAAISFANTNYAPSTTQRVVNVTVGDGIATSNTATSTIAVVDLNPATSGTLANQHTTDGQSPVSIATAGGFSDPSGSPLTYTAKGLPTGLSIDPSTGIITGSVDHDGSKNAPATSGSGATLDGTYTVTVTATDSAGRSVMQGFTLDSMNQAPVIGTAIANQSNQDGDTVTPLDASKAFADPNGDPLAYSATGLPPGLSISSAGLITGTIAGNAMPGPYSVAVTATDDKGAQTPETFTWTVKDVPPTASGSTLSNQSYADGQSGISIATSQAFSPSNGNALSYSASGLPAGLSIDATSGQITGTIDHDASKNAPVTTGSGATLDGTYKVVVTASDGLGGTATQGFTIDSSNGAPVVGTNTVAQSNKTGSAIASVDASKAFSDPNGDPLTYSASNLPKGLSIDSATGIISGTVAPDAKPGSYAVRVLAIDDKGAATREGFYWTIADTPPTANGTLANQTYADATANIAIDTSGGFISPNKLPLSYTASGLPKGLSIDPSTGMITGQLDHDASEAAPVISGAGATLDGTYTVTVTASDGQGGTAQQVFKIDATNNAPTLVAQMPDQAGADGQTVSLDGAKPFNDINTGDTFTYAAAGLPTGLFIDPKTGLVSGTIDPHASVKGPFTVIVTITDDKGAATSESFRWSVNDVPPAATPALPDRSVSDGTAVSVTTAGGFTNPNNVAYTYTATGLPKGLAIDTNTGVISGTIDHDASTGGSGGSYAIAVTADDGQGGTATNSFHLTSSNQAPVVGTKTPAQANLDGDTITSVDASKAFSDPNGDPLTYSASALPAGLVIDPKTGIISGTVSPSAAAGAYSVAITATDDKGLKTTETFGWTIGSVPPQANGTIANKTFADGTPGIGIDTASAFTDRNSNTLSYSASGLPAGLSIDPTTGKITGTLDHDASADAPKTGGSGATLDGTYTIVVTAADGIGGTATQTFTIDATNQASNIAANTPKQTNTDGDVISVNAGEAFVDPNTGDIVTYTALNLPAGLTIDAKTGVISGTLQNSDYSHSPFAVSITATDDKNAATTETFQWVVGQAEPAVYSPIPNAASFDGRTISIDTASHFSTDGGTVYSATGLPKGLTIDPATGVISGTIDHDASVAGPNPTGSGRTADSVYAVSVTASNTSNTSSTSQTFALDVANQAPVVGTVTADQSHKDGDTIATVDASQAFSDPNGDPLTYSANNLPPGLVIDTATGRITGTVAGNAYPGDYKVTVTAIDDKGAATSEVFTWTIADVPPSTNGAIDGQTAADGSSGISFATAGGFTPTNRNPLYYAATGLPSGLTIDPRTGVISGAIDRDASTNAPQHKAGATLDGTYAITVTAYDGLGGSAVQTFAFDATNTAPAFKQTPDQHGQDGQNVSLAPSFSDANGDPLTYSAMNLPLGLSINPTTGLISGTINKTASKNGTYNVTVTATDDKNAATNETFKWVVDNVAPAATPPLADRSINDGTAVSYATNGGFTNPNGLTLTYSATGLPSGLSIDPATGLISGTLNHDASAATSGGVYTVSVTVDDGQGGTATNTFHLTASNQAPVVGMPLANQSNKDGDAVSSVDTSKAFNDPNPGDVLTYAASNLPKGLTIDTKTGIISGTVAGDAAPGGYYVTVTATDDKGAATPATFTWAVNDVPPTAAGALPGQRFIDSQNGIDIATAGGFTSPNGLPLTFSATGLPRGLSIDPSSGAITGFISHNASSDAPHHTGSNGLIDGTYTVIVTADDGQGGTATQTFTIDSTNQAPTLGMPTADQRAADGQQVSIDAGKSFADPNTGDTLTFTAGGLPAGLNIDPATGLISGTIDPHASASGPYAVTVTATDNKGAATSETFQFAVNEVPPTAGVPVAAASAADGTAIAPIDTASHFSSPNGLPLTYAATGLPAGLSIDPATGLISGTVDHDASKNAPVVSGSGATLDGTYSVTVTASDGQGGVATQSFTFDATNSAPAVTAQTPDQHATDGQSVSLDASKAFTDPNTGDIIAYAASGLPTGLSIDPATGLITGTIDPRASSTGPYTVTVTATDDKGAAKTETFAWTVADAPPKAGTLPDQSASDGTAVSIATAGGFSDPNGLPLTYAATGLPAGLAIDPATGVISGTLDHDASVRNGSGAGTYTIVVTASDGQGGSATDIFHLTSSNQAPFVGNKTVDQSNSDGATIMPVDASQAFTDPNGDPLTYAATNLPVGLAIDPATGRITGMVTGNAQPGTYQVTVTATDDKRAATSEAFAWTIADVPPMAQGTLSAQHLSDGQGGVSIATANGFSDANGNPLAYAATGLPAGLSIDPKTGAITGTLDRNASTGGNHGSYTVTLTASDGLGGTATQTLMLDARNAAPVVGLATADQSNNDGASIAPVDASKAFTDPNGDPLTFNATNLPAGLTIDPATGRITGTVAGNARPGTYKVAVTATDDKGAATSESFAWTIVSVPPTAQGTLAKQSFGDGTSGIAIDTAAAFADANGNALTFTATGLPAGLAIDPSSGRITGTLNHDASKNAPVTSGAGATLDGTYTVTVTASDGLGGSATQGFTLDARNAAPVVGTRTADQKNTEGDAVSLDAASAFADPDPGDTLTYSAGSLPGCLAIDPKTGLITGIVAKGDNTGSPYTVTVTATDDKGAASSETLSWTILPTKPVAASPLNDMTAADGAAVSIETATHFANDGAATTYAASGLPSGLSIDSSTGRITGTLDHDASKNAPATTGSGATLDGGYTVTVTATTAGGTVAQSFKLDAINQAPIVGTKTADQSNKDGATIAAVDTSGAFADPNGDPLTYTAANLPAGLSIDPATGLVTGTVAGNARPGTYQVAVTATDDKGAATTETFAWTISDVPPTAQGTLAAQPLADGQGGVAIATAGGFSDANGNPLTYAASGLPAGLSIDPKTGAITGTLDRNASTGGDHGRYAVTVTASDGLGGTAIQTLTIAAANQAPAVGTRTADQSNKDGDTVSPVEASQAFADANGDPLTYAAANLPAGLSIDPATGLLTGTVAGNARPGTYQVAVTATDDKGAATTETFAWTISDVPPTAQGTLAAPSLADGQGGIAIATAGGFSDANGNPLTYAASGLPVGLSIDPKTGAITGTLDRNASTGGDHGRYTVTVTASDGLGGTATQTLTITAANTAPAVGIRTADRSNKDGETISPVEASQAFADANGDPLTYTAANLPAGLSIDPATGRITGTVAGYARPGTYQVAVTATDDKGADTTETFAWTIADVPPTAQGTLAAQPLADGQGSIAIATAGGFSDANGNPLTYAASGLPAGLTIDPKTGAISGTLDRNASTGGDHGRYAVTVTASDGLGGTATQTLTIAAANQAPVVGTNTADQHGQDGQTVSLDTAPAFADPNGDALTYSAANLPPGLSIDPTTGRITGTIASTASAGGSYAVAVTAMDGKGGSTIETFAWMVDNLAPVANSNAPIDVGPLPDGATVAPFDAAAAFTNANGLPLTYAASGLPAGLVIDPATGIVTGTLDHDASTGGDHGTYTVTVSASDGQGGTASQTYTLEATNQVPALVAPTSDQAGVQGETVAPLDASQAFADPNAGDVVTYAASGLPKGLAIDPATGLITGTIAPDARPSDNAVTVVATDDKGAATAETFVWTVGEVSPVAGNLPPQHFGDGQGGIAIDTAKGFASPNGLPLTYDAGGLPAGLSIDPATGLISGTLDRNASALAPVKLGSGSSLEGIYAVTITAADPFGGTTSQVFAIEVDNVPPAIVVRTPDQHGRAGQATGPLELGSAFGDASGDTLTFAVTGLPPGLAFDQATGRVTGVIDPALRSSGVYTVTVTATDEKGASVAESFLYTVDTVAPSILPPPSFFEPAAALLPNILGALPVRIADLGHGRSVEPATPILDVINQTSGAEEKSQVIALDGIVVSTVNGIAPLNGLERLIQPGEGIVRSGAATNEIGDRIARTQNAIGRGVEALSTPLNFLGATSIDVGSAGRGESGPPINIETMLRDRVLSISVGSGAGPGDALARVTVTLADGRPLPAWLRADGKGYLVGKVPGGVERIDIKVTSIFASGATSQRSVTIRTDRGTITPLAQRPQAGRTLSHMIGASHAASADLSRIARLLG